MSKTFDTAIPMIDKDGEGVTFTPVDPNLPCGKLEGQSEDDVVNDWLEKNYPNITKEQLNDMGITVEFEPGEETYELYDESGSTHFVSEDEYNQHASELNTENGNTTANHLSVEGNDSKIDSINSEGGVDHHVGISHKEPGKIKIHVDNADMSNYMDDILNSELTVEEAKKINQVLEDMTGVKNAVSSGMSIKSAYDGILKTLENSDFDVKNKSIRVSGLLLTVVLKPGLDILDLENLWDADNGGLAETINKLAKTGNYIVVIVGMTELASGGTASAALLAAGLICTIADTVIRDKDTVDIFKLNDENKIEYDFVLKNEAGEKIHFNETIKLDYSDPQILINKIYAYLETAKLQLDAQLDILRNRRVEIITQVKQDIEDEMYSLAYDVCVGKTVIEKNDGKAIKALCEIYNATQVSFTNPVIQFNYDPQPTSDLNELLEDVKEKDVKVAIAYNGFSFSYTVSSVSTGLPTSTLDAVVYDGDLYVTRTVILKEKPTIEDLNEHCKEYIHSYYQYVYKNNKYIKDDYITDYTNEDVVSVGTVVTSNEVINKMKEEGYNIQERAKNMTNFMSRNRNLLAKQMVTDFYNKAINIAYDYASTTDQVEALEKQLVSAWDAIYSDKGE